MVQQQEYPMKVLFEKAGWQIRQLSDETDMVYMVHTKCEPYAYYTNLFKCAACKAQAPKSIETLVVLYNWRTK